MTKAFQDPTIDSIKTSMPLHPCHSPNGAELLVSNDLFDEFESLERKSSFATTVSERSSSTTTTTTTTTSTTTGTTRCSVHGAMESNRIRSRYLFKLGMIAPSPPERQSIPATSASLRKATTTITEEVQKCDRSIQSSSSSSSQRQPLQDTTNGTSTSTASQKSLKKKVRFQTRVETHPIPHHCHYLIETKQNVWISPIEMEEMVYRNYIEFSSEQWDWRQVVEEDEFCWYGGVWTHPAHAVNRFTTCRQFCLIRSAQQEQELQQKQQRQRQRQFSQSYHRIQPCLYGYN